MGMDTLFIYFTICFDIVKFHVLSSIQENIKAFVCVNKYDLNSENAENIENYCKADDIEFLGMIPFDPKVTESMVNATPIVEYAPDSPASNAIRKIWAKFNTIIG